MFIRNNAGEGVAERRPMVIVSARLAFYVSCAKMLMFVNANCTLSFLDVTYATGILFARTFDNDKRRTDEHTCSDQLIYDRNKTRRCLWYCSGGQVRLASCTAAIPDPQHSDDRGC